MKKLNTEMHICRTKVGKGIFIQFTIMLNENLQEDHLFIIKGESAIGPTHISDTLLRRCLSAVSIRSFQQQTSNCLLVSHCVI